MTRRARGAETQRVVAEYFRANATRLATLYPAAKGDLAARLASRIAVSTEGCWVWTGGLSAKGYAQTRVGKGKRMAHRIVWQLAHGPIPDRLQLDHLCRNRPCVNPAHLEPVTARENTLRSPISIAGRFAARDECAHGHPLVVGNLIQHGGRPNVRICATCHRRRGREYYARKRAARV